MSNFVNEAVLGKVVSQRGMIIGDIYFEDYSPPKQMRSGEYEDIYFYVKNIGDEAGYIWVDHYRNGTLIRDSLEVLLPGSRVHLFTPGYIIQGEGLAEYEIRVGHFTNYPNGKTQDGLLYFVIEEELISPPGLIICHRCKPVGDGYSVPESKEFEGNVCHEGWSEIQQPCNVPPCLFYTNQSECITHGCYWYDGSCHSVPSVPPTMPSWVLPVAIAIAGVAVTVLIIKSRG